jgi:hypothetical protein
LYRPNCKPVGLTASDAPFDPAVLDILAVDRAVAGQF